MRFDDGEILVSGPNFAPNTLDADGWLRTGDLGGSTQSGRLRIIGRRGDTIVSGGENVAPAEVEAVLLEHPAVADAGVFSRPDPEWGERVVATVVLRAGPCGHGGRASGVRREASGALQGAQGDRLRRRAAPHRLRQAAAPRASLTPVAGENIDEQRELLLDGWDEAAKGWGRQADRTQSVALPISEWMIAHTRPAPGEQVLELAAGPGDTGFMAARLIEPGGTLICSDAVAGMLDVARERAEEQGIANVEFKQLQLEWIDLPTASVDVVLCRWAVMLIFDPQAALRECRRVLKPGGRLALAVWDPAEANPWATIIQRVLVELGHVEPTPAGGPGMFALGRARKAGRAARGRCRSSTSRRSRSRSCAATPASLDWLGETRDLSRQFAGVWGRLSDEERQALREAVAAAAAEYIDASGAVALPGSSLAAVASA